MAERGQNRDKSSAQNTHAGFGDRFIAFANTVSDVSGLVAAYLLVPLVVVFLIEIVSRNVFNHPTTWASGTCFLIGGCAAVLGFGYAMKSGAMVRIDALSSKLPEKTHCILDLILYAVLFLPLTIGGSYECIKNAVVSVSKLETLSTGSWNAPIWPTKIVMSISLIILTLQGLAEIIQLVQRLRAAKREGEQ